MSETEACFRYAPPYDAPAFNPLIGEVKPGVTYEIPAHLVPRFEHAQDWEPVENSKQRTQAGCPRTKRKV